MLERLKLFEKDAPYRFVLFDHNPQMLKVSRQAKNTTGAVQETRTAAGAAAAAAPGGSGSTGTRNPNTGVQPTAIVVSKARLIGPEVKLSSMQLLTWVTKADPLFSAADVDAVEAPTLVMVWGPPMAGFTFECKLKRVDITYIRVSMVGIPTHAVVNLTLSEEPSSIPFTNPTSGGLPGRDRHVVISDETLMSIATAKFGGPAAWRAIAEVNDIDDPHSIRPGDMIYLPSRDEIRRPAGRV